MDARRSRASVLGNNVRTGFPADVPSLLLAPVEGPTRWGYPSRVGSGAVPVRTPHLLPSCDLVEPLADHAFRLRGLGGKSGVWWPGSSYARASTGLTRQDRVYARSSYSLSASFAAVVSQS